MIPDAVIAFAKQQGYDSAEKCGKWKGYDVYEPVFAGDDIVCVGLPLVILVKVHEMRMSTSDEAMQILDDMDE